MSLNLNAASIPALEVITIPMNVYTSEIVFIYASPKTLSAEPRVETIAPRITVNIIPEFAKIEYFFAALDNTFAAACKLSCLFTIPF